MSSQANAAQSKHYLVDVWQGEHGLAQSAISGITQTPDGFLWVSTFDGVARFDGSQFRMFKAGNTPALGTGRVRFLSPGRDGSFWLSIQEGNVIRFQDGQFTPLNFGTSIAAQPASVHVVEDKVGAVWLSMEDGNVGRMANNTFSMISTNWDPKGKTAYQVRADARGDLWAMTRTGLFKVEGERLIPSLDGKPSEYTIHCPGRSGGWWITTSNQLRLWRDEQWITTLPGPTNAPITLRCSLEDRLGRVWIGSAGNGLFRCDTNGTLLQFTKADGLSSDSIRTLFEDVEGNIWVGTEGGGLNRLREPMFKVYGREQGLSPSLTMTVSAGAKGDIWIGTDGAGLKRLRGETIEKGFGSDASPLHAMTVLADRRGRVWLSTRAGGIYRYYNDKMIRVGQSIPSGLSARSIFEDSSGAVWLGWRAATNLTRIQDDKITVFPLPESLPPVDVRVMAEDATGNFWIGTDGYGVLQWKDGKFTRFTKENGLASDFIWALHAEPDGTLWIGTYGGGLSRLKNGRAVTCTTGDGLVDDIICHIEEDDQEQFWFNSYQGVFRVSKTELNRFADGASDRLHCIAYGKADGLPSLQGWGGYQAVGCQSPDGRIWFLNSGGLVVFNPKEISLTSAPPRTFIDEMLVDDEVTDLRKWQDQFIANKSPGRNIQELKIHPGSRRFQFRYSALNFNAPEKLRFRHKLEGVDADWVDSSGQRSVSYTRLSSGSYIFRVQSCNREGVWSQPGASIAFTILPFFWQTKSFISMFLLVFGSIIGIVVAKFVKRRQRRHLQLLERLHAAERERTRIARDIHDDLGASLTEIGYLGALGVRDSVSLDQAREHLGRIMDRTRDLVRKVDQTVWAVNPKNDSPDHLATYLSSYTRELLESVNIRCRLDVAMNLPAVELTTEARHSVFLAVKEALNNALRHSGATEISLRLTANDSCMTIEVSDNGCGFHTNNGHSDGNGLRNMAERMDDIGGKFTVQSRPTKGTTIVLQVPLRSSWMPRKYQTAPSN